MLLRELSDLDGEGQVAGAEDVYDAVVEEPRVEPQLLKETSKLPGRDSSLREKRKIERNCIKWF